MHHAGCLCIRNIAGRCPDLRAILLDAGVESVLRKAGTHRYDLPILPFNLTVMKSKTILKQFLLMIIICTAEIVLMRRTRHSETCRSRSSS